MSPPISADPNPGRVAYATTKMGMTRIALGVAAEHKKDNVASNALWPATLIESQATINWGMEDRSRWRSPEILSDATMEILKSKPKILTGRQLVDEDIWRATLAELQHNHDPRPLLPLDTQHGKARCRRDERGLGLGDLPLPFSSPRC